MTTTETFFSVLKEHRESKSIQIEEISEYTKIHPRYIEAIEEGNFNILPNVYMRLFLRSYALYLDVDRNKVLEDYELHTTGKVQNKSEFELVEKESSNNKNIKPKSAETNDIDISHKKIITIALVVVGIFLIFKLISSISQEQQSIEQESQDTMQPINPNEEIIEEEIVKQTTSLNKQKKYSTLPNLAVLNETDFDPLKKKDEPVILPIKITLPANFHLTTKTQTKVNFSILSENFSYNKVLPADTTISVPFEKTISFDFWSANHISSNIGGISLDEYFTDQDLAIRGWYDVENNVLIFSYYSH